MMQTTEITAALLKKVWFKSLISFHIYSRYAFYKTMFSYVFQSISTDPLKTTSPLQENVTMRKGDQNGKRPQIAGKLYLTSPLSRYYHVARPKKI